MFSVQKDMDIFFYHKAEKNWHFVETAIAYDIEMSWKIAIMSISIYHTSEKHFSCTLIG